MGCIGSRTKGLHQDNLFFSLHETLHLALPSLPPGHVAYFRLEA